MPEPHVIKALFDTIELFITEQAAPACVHGSPLLVLIFRTFFSFFKSEVGVSSLLVIYSLFCVFQIILELVQDVTLWYNIMALITDLTFCGLINAQKDAAFGCIWITFLVFFFALLVLLALLMFVQLLDGFEVLVACLTFVHHLGYGTGIGRDHF